MDGQDTKLVQAFDRVSNGTLRIDVERYQHLLDELDLTGEQRRQVLEAIWNMMVAFVDLGFRVEPLEESCGKPSDPTLQDAFEVSGAVESMDHEKE